MNKIVFNNSIVTSKDLFRQIYINGPTNMSGDWRDWANFFLSGAITLAEGNLNQKGNVLVRRNEIYRSLKTYYIMESDKENVIINR